MEQQYAQFYSDRDKDKAKKFPSRDRNMASEFKVNFEDKLGFLCDNTGDKQELRQRDKTDRKLNFIIYQIFYIHLLGKDR